MLNKIEKLSQILNESYNEKTLNLALEDFFEQNFHVRGFAINNEKCANYSYPIFKHKKTIGYLEFDNANQELKNFLKVTAQFISLKIQNIMLNDKMQKDIYFRDTMRNIAKIIENQYELNYIIPIIGEMLDKFFPNYLCYLFLCKDDSGIAELSWPSACNDFTIQEMVKISDRRQNTPDGKICSIPLWYEDKNFGVIVLKSMGQAITTKDFEYIDQLSKQISTTIQKAKVYIETLKYATVDALTGFYNKRQLEERIKQETSNSKRQKAPLCGMMIDIDYFKKVNDTFGHIVGDLVLKTIAKVIRSQLREYDIAGRFGGEEFFIILPFTKIKEAKMVAERLRKATEECLIDISKANPDAGIKHINVTISLGIYEFKLTDNEEDLTKQADKALYEAKNTGRNKVVIYEY